MSESLTLDELRARIQKAEKSHIALLRKSLTKYSPDIVEQYEKFFKDRQDYYELRQELGAIDIEHLKCLFKKDKVLGRVMKIGSTGGTIPQDLVDGSGLMLKVYNTAVEMSLAAENAGIASVIPDMGMDTFVKRMKILEKCRTNFLDVLRVIELYHLKEVQNAKSS